MRSIMGQSLTEPTQSRQRRAPSVSSVWLVTSSHATIGEGPPCNRDEPPFVASCVKGQLEDAECVVVHHEGLLKRRPIADGARPCPEPPRSARTLREGARSVNAPAIPQRDRPRGTRRAQSVGEHEKGPACRPGLENRS